jgi:hypothetical protein
MTPTPSPQSRSHQPSNALPSRRPARGTQDTWELPVEQPRYAPAPEVLPISPDTEVSARRLWAGGGATAAVAAGIGVVGVLLVRGLLGIPILSARGQLVDQAMAVVPITAGLAALTATALLHLLLLTTPRPGAFFGAICAIAITIMVLQVLLVSGTVEQQVATSMLYIVIGVGITSLLAGVARTAVRSATSGHDLW